MIKEAVFLTLDNGECSRNPLGGYMKPFPSHFDRENHHSITSCLFSSRCLCNTCTVELAKPALLPLQQLDLSVLERELLYSHSKVVDCLSLK
jgi:hypothetical protein